MNNYEITIYLNEDVKYPVIKAVSFYRQLLKYGEVLNTEPNIFTNTNRDNIYRFKYSIKTSEKDELLNEFLNRFKNKTPEIKKVYLKSEQSRDIQKEKIKSETSYIRIKSSIISKINNYIGELIITKSNLLGLIYKLKYLSNTKEIYNEFYSAYQKFDDIMFQLNELSLSVNMVNFESLYTRLINTARELCNKSKNKKIKLILAGEDTLIEKEIITKISDPLIHLLRNSIDHGIEPVQERINAGKDSTGIIKINTYSESNSVIIEISDDGRGIDLERIKERVRQKRLAKIEEIEKMTEKQLMDFIFQPGFSTAEKITDVSGRGVGMDIVKESLNSVNGVIDIVTKLRKGTKFILKIPLSLSIIETLMIKCNSNIISIPTVSIIGIIRYNPKILKRILNKDVILYKNQIIPVIKIDNLMNYNSEKEMDYRYIIIVGAAEKRLGLFVEDIIDKQEIMVKMFNQYLGNIKGLIGATILGNGEVSLILNIKEIIEIYETKQGTNYE